MGSGICGAALVRAANAMLTALGGDQVILLLPATATSANASGQLGLVDPGVQGVMITPVDNQQPGNRQFRAEAEDRVYLTGFGD